MLKILIIICVLFSFLCAVLCESWLRKYRGKGEELAEVIGIVAGRNSYFWSFQYIPVLISVIIMSCAVGALVDWQSACIYAAGAAVSFAAVLIGSRAMISGTAAAFNSVKSGDMKRSMTASYRTGSVMGYIVAGSCAAIFALLFAVLKVDKAITASVFMAFGACSAALLLHIGGHVYSSAYVLASPDDDFADRTGIFAGSAADIAATILTSLSAAVILSESAVLSSGVTSPLTLSVAAKFPVIVCACGIFASAVGNIIYRASSKSDSSAGASVSALITAALVIALSVYFSSSIMESNVYAWPLSAGAAAGLLISEVSRFFSSGSRPFVLGSKEKKRLGKNMPVVFDLGTGMISIIINIVVILAAIYCSNLFTGYYGIALCAVGMASVSVSNASMMGMSVVTPSVSELLSDFEDSAVDIMRDSFDITASRSRSVSGSYMSVSAISSAIAMYFAFAYLSKILTVNAMSAAVFAGLFTGAASAFVLMGMVIGSVGFTGRAALRDIRRNDDEAGAVGSLRGYVIPAVASVLFPAGIGLLLGLDALAGFLLASLATCYMLAATLGNSGSNFENTASQSLNSIIKIMIVLSVAFLPVIMSIGGVIG